ncbi:MAG TPA: alkene reductase [Ohtaekwangia sp.]|uniref:alkene reductase n=1 Tax=Ohtaekwangia sp. TaxID=2066019 RepID=UPI002F932033
MSTKVAFTAYKLGEASLDNRIVMAPMTRLRAINNVPNELIAHYYGQRAAAGLIISEGVSPSPNGLGYARMPGLFSEEQVKGWKLVTDAVHKKGGKIFAQLMHAGRIGHPLNLPKGAKLVAPSAIAAAGEMWTDQEGKKEHPVPQALSLQELEETKNEFIQAARNAIAAGFDGIELHSANGYLLEQFISPFSNKRTDNYGGSIENRTRFVLEVATAAAQAIGRDKVGIRLSPYGIYNDMPHYDEIDATYTYLAEKLNDIGVVYIHLVDHSGMGAPEVPLSIKKAIRDKFKNTLILSGGYTLARAEEDLAAQFADLVAFGKPFISNPDLVERLRKNLPLNIKLDVSTFYSAEAKGLIDYPVFEEESVNA